MIAGCVYLPPVAITYNNSSESENPDSNLDANIGTLLSDRQIQVLKLIIEGRPNKGIADKLCISENTVKTHVSAVMRALETNNRTETVYKAARLGMLLE